MEGDKEVNNQFQEWWYMANLEMWLGAEGAEGFHPCRTGCFKGWRRPLRSAGVLKLGFPEYAQESTSWRKEFQVEKTVCIKEQQCERTRDYKSGAIKKILFFSNSYIWAPAIFFKHFPQMALQEPKHGLHEGWVLVLLRKKTGWFGKCPFRPWGSLKLSRCKRGELLPGHPLMGRVLDPLILLYSPPSPPFPLIQQHGLSVCCFIT